MTTLPSPRNVGRLVGSVLELARAIRHAPDRLLHSWRRRRALHRVRSAGVPGRALFLCHGNINRSPYAAAAFGRAAEERGFRIETASAGFIGPGRPCPAVTVEMARRRGLDLGAHESRLVHAADLEGADLVIVMDPRQRRRARRQAPRARGRVIVLGDLDPRPIHRRAVPDPYGAPDDVFEEVYARVDRCIDALVSALLDGPDPSARPSGTGPSGSYRR
jgi:protein-tyrosine phosphatase